jgi:hypothetical protein
MRIASGRRAAALLLGLSLAASTPIGLGCAMDPNLMSVLTAPVERSDDDSGRTAYEAGYAAGVRDDQRQRRADYTRHQEAYDWNTERAFATGYRDGYAGEADRYGSSGNDGRYGEDDGGDRYGMSPAVPTWLIGDYRGWDESYGVDVALSIHRDASVLFVAGGRQRQGFYRGGQVHLRNGAYAVTRVRDGIRFTHVEDARNTVYLRRTD